MDRCQWNVDCVSWWWQRACWKVSNDLYSVNTVSLECFDTSVLLTLYSHMDGDKSLRSTWIDYDVVFCIGSSNGKSSRSRTTKRAFFEGTASRNAKMYRNINSSKLFSYALRTASGFQLSPPSPLLRCSHSLTLTRKMQRPVMTPNHLHPQFLQSTLPLQILLFCTTINILA